MSTLIYIYIHTHVFIYLVAGAGVDRSCSRVPGSSAAVRARSPAWSPQIAREAKAFRKFARHASTPHCSSIKGLIVFVRWYLGSLKGYLYDPFLGVLILAL